MSAKQGVHVPTKPDSRTTTAFWVSHKGTIGLKGMRRIRGPLRPPVARAEGSTTGVAQSQGIRAGVVTPGCFRRGYQRRRRRGWSVEAGDSIPPTLPGTGAALTRAAGVLGCAGVRERRDRHLPRSRRPARACPTGQSGPRVRSVPAAGCPAHRGSRPSTRSGASAPCARRQRPARPPGPRTSGVPGPALRSPNALSGHR